LIDIYKIPVAWSLSVTLVVLVATMILSLKIPPKGKAQAAYPFAAKHDEEEAKRQD
jgi:tellurite resistance protein TerC